MINKVETTDTSMQQLNASNVTMDVADDGQLMIDNNIIMSMIKLGIQTGSATKKVTKTNEIYRAASVTEAKDYNSWVMVDEKGQNASTVVRGEDEMVS